MTASSKKNEEELMTRVQFKTNKYDRENAEKLVKSKYGLTLNQYFNMKVVEFSNEYLNDEEVLSDETQKIVNDAVDGKLDGTTYDNVDAFLKDLGLER
ncbi:hypothetical protein [Paucilactobacillus nenjiangensis]|uniref:hypothetical protein n=1 Tax=Paucilactobacillus nenjiangensis TaxID=1296540 RepID=UPI003BB0A50D